MTKRKKETQKERQKLINIKAERNKDRNKELKMESPLLIRFYGTIEPGGRLILLISLKKTYKKKEDIKEERHKKERKKERTKDGEPPDLFLW